MCAEVITPLEKAIYSAETARPRMCAEVIVDCGIIREGSKDNRWQKSEESPGSAGYGSC